MVEYRTVKIRKDSYEMARKQAEKEGEAIIEIIAKAIDRYVNTRKDLEEKARLVIKLLEEKEVKQQ
jgi:hypothetical protein